MRKYSSFIIKSTESAGKEKDNLCEFVDAQSGAKL